MRKNTITQKMAQPRKYSISLKGTITIMFCKRSIHENYIITRDCFV